MLPERDSPEFKAYLKAIAKGDVFYPFYNQAVVHAEDMGVHIEGDLPVKLLNINRPNETPEVKEYRLAIWQPVTEGPSQKVINTFNKVFNPKGFQVKWPNNNQAQTVEEYVNGEIPQYKSWLRFFTEAFTKKDFSDPNGIYAILPAEFDIEPTERFEPVPVFYPSDSIVDFKEGEYYTLVYGLQKNGEITLDKGIIKKNPEIRVIQIITGESIEIYTKVNRNNGSFSGEIIPIPQSLDEPPVFRLGGVVEGKYSPHWYKSFVSGVLPHWNRVVTLSSDLDANYNSHLYMERWSYVSECVECSGSGYIQAKVTEGPEDYTQKICNKCGGSGTTTKSPYGEHKISRTAFNPDEVIPTPPAGFISKDTSIVTKIEERIDTEELKGFSSINMEIMSKVGEDQSGVAKTIDREDRDAVILTYGAHVFGTILRSIFSILQRGY